MHDVVLSILILHRSRSIFCDNYIAISIIIGMFTEGVKSIPDKFSAKLDLAI